MRNYAVRVLLIAVAVTMIAMGMSAVSPILPQYVSKFGAPISSVGLLVSTQYALFALFSLPSGLLADRWGRKPMIVSGAFLVACGALVLWYAPTITFLFAGQVLVGIGMAFYSISALSMVADSTDSTNRSKANGLYFLGSQAGAILGPLIGGVVAFQSGLRSTYLLYAGLAVLACLYALFFLHETHLHKAAGLNQPAIQQARPKGDWKRAFTRILILVYLIDLTFAFCFMPLAQTIIPLRIKELGADSRTIGIIFSIFSFSAVALFFPSGVLADKFGRRNVIIPAGILGCLAFLGLRLAPTVPFFTAAMILMGVSAGLITTIPPTLVGDYAPPEARGTAMGIYRSIGQIGTTISPTILGLVGQYTNLVNTFLVVFLVCAVGVSLMFFLPKGKPS